MYIQPIATITTPFSEKFTIPRQAQIVHEAHGKLTFCSEFAHPDSLHGLEAHSHYWLIWGFHTNSEKEKSLTVRPPRLGGNTKVGVFATRSPFRPNNLGLSVVKLEHIDTKNSTVIFSGVDMLTHSPIYDIKPYVPYADIQGDACSDWAQEAPQPSFSVVIEPCVLQVLTAYDNETGLQLTQLVRTLLMYDPRPAYKKARIDDKIYATRLYDMDVAWNIVDSTVTVISATKIV